MILICKVTLLALGPPSVTNRTMTGFSDPATNPNPKVEERSRVTVLGIGFGRFSLFLYTGVS